MLKELANAIALRKVSLCFSMDDENYPGAEFLDKLCEHLGIEEGGEIKWEQMDAPGTGKKTILFSIDLPPVLQGRPRLHTNASARRRASEERTGYNKSERRRETQREYARRRRAKLKNNQS